MKTAIELADEFPEQNLANLEPDAANILNGWGIEAVAMLLQQAEQLSAWLAANGPGGWIDDLRNKCEALEITNDALKADAERWKTIKPHFYFDNEGGHGFWNCSISSESWTVDGVVPDAAIDSMKGKS